MAYFQILAIVLCACFIQDAFSMQQHNPPTRSPMKRIGTVKNMASRKALPPPPLKYPHLTAVKDFYWDTWEAINRANENGKLNTRAVRNLVGELLTNEEFWSSLVLVFQRKVKMTNDKRKADKKIRMCNVLASVITNPMAVDTFQEVANEVYGTMTKAQSKVSTDALKLVSEMVNSGEVTRGLNEITKIVINAKLNPTELVKGFDMLHKTLDLGGTVNMGQSLSSGIMTLSSIL